MIVEFSCSSAPIPAGCSEADKNVIIHIAGSLTKPECSFASLRHNAFVFLGLFRLLAHSSRRSPALATVSFHARSSVIRPYILQFQSFHGSSHATPPISSSLRSSSSSRCSPIRLNCGVRRRSSPDSFVVVCCSASGSPGVPSSHGHSDFLEASLLVPEMISHYRMLRRGSSEEVKWQSTGKMLVLSVREREPMIKFTTLGKGFLSRFQGPTIFLKVSCDGDFLLPIIVGEFAIERLLDSLLGEDNLDCRDQFYFLRNVVLRLGYEVKMVRITERVINTYFAKIYISKPGDNDILIVDARPSDAISVATRCKAPIYINRNIILMDAIRIGYDMGRGRHGRSTYDVLLDSAADGPDLLTEELTLLCNMNLAIKEERYTDAAMWRDRLMELRDSRCNS